MKAVVCCEDEALGLWGRKKKERHTQTQPARLFGNAFQPSPRSLPRRTWVQGREAPRFPIGLKHVHWMEHMEHKLKFLVDLISRNKNLGVFRLKVPKAMGRDTHENDNNLRRFSKCKSRQRLDQRDCRLASVTIKGGTSSNEKFDQLICSNILKQTKYMSVIHQSCWGAKIAVVLLLEQR